MSRPRVDPRAVSTTVGRDGRPRIDRSGTYAPGTRSAPSDAAHQPRAPRRERCIEAPAFHVLAVPDLIDGRLDARDRAVLALARALADAEHAPAQGAVAVLTFEPGGGGIDWGAEGVDRVLEYRTVPGYAPEVRLPALLAALADVPARHVVLPESSDVGAELGRRLAAACNEAPATRVRYWSRGSVVRGAADPHAELTGPAPRILLVEDAAAPPVTARHVVRIDAPRDASVAPRVRDAGALPYDAANLPLAEAEVVLSAGAGIRDLDALAALARRLNATIGASRVVTDAGRLPRDRQVGASGSTTAARVYVAFGISGAPQHLHGIERCRDVAAVNLDASCPMFRRAGLALQADADGVLRAMLARLAEDSARE